MITTIHTTLRMSGALSVEHLTALKLHIGVNAHGWAIVEGEAGENALEQISGALAGREQHILTLDESGAEKCLFAGVIREAELVRVGGYNRFHVELLSGTCLMDREVRSRSFQDVGRTYSQVAQQVCSEYGGGAAICTVGEDKTLGQPVIQYRETDWDFLMRMASHCGGVLVPETHRGLPRLWFGFPDRSFTCEFPEDAYTSGISQRYYELGGSEAGYSKADFFYYDVESPQLCDLGWYTVFKGQPFIISEKYAILERGELIFTYRLGRPVLGWGKMLYNEKISGMTLLGEVLETSRETLKLKLDIDAGWNPGGPYPYTWRPETGNFMYCMPQVGTRVSLYCPNYDEKAAIAVNCVRTNGSDCDRMSDPSRRSFVTEHGKEMNLYPKEMSFLGGNLGLIQVIDEEGVSFSSHMPIAILARQKVTFETSCWNAGTINGNLSLKRLNYSSANSESSFSMSGVFDNIANFFTGALGWVCTAFPAFDDAPTEAKFDVLGLIGNVIGGVVASAVVGALIGLTVIAFPWAAAAAVGAKLATGAIIMAIAIGAAAASAGIGTTLMYAADDIARGKVSSAGFYRDQAILATLKTGATLQRAYSFVAPFFGGFWPPSAGMYLVADGAVLLNPVALAQITLGGFGNIYVSLNSAQILNNIANAFSSTPRDSSNNDQKNEATEEQESETTSDPKDVVSPGIKTGDQTPQGKEFTEHAAQQATKRGYSPQDIDSIISNWTEKYYQPGGRTVYIKRQSYGYDVVIIDKNGKSIITVVGGNGKNGVANTLHNLDDVKRMLENQGGYSTIPIY